MKGKGVWILLIILLLPVIAKAETISLDPCGTTKLYEQGNGGNAEWVMENNCIKIEMRKGNYDTTTEVYDKLNDRYFSLMANQLEERSQTQGKTTTTLTSMNLESNIDKGYIEWTNNQGFSLGYAITGNKFKFVGNITNWSYQTTDGELWLDMKLHKNEGDIFEFIPTIVDGIEQPIINDSRTAGQNNFVAMNLGRGYEIIIDPIYYIDLQPIPSRLYDNGEQTASSYTSFDTPTTITTILNDGNTETREEIENKGVDDDRIIRAYFNHNYTTGHQYFIRFYKRNSDSTSITIYPHNTATTITTTPSSTESVNGIGWKNINVTDISNYMTNTAGLGYLEYRLTETTEEANIEVSELMLRDEINDTQPPTISNCQVSANNFTCEESINFTCTITDNLDVSYATYTIDGNTYSAIQNNNLWTVTITENLTGTKNYSWTVAQGCDIFNQCDDTNPSLSVLYTCGESCDESWTQIMTPIENCQIDNTITYLITYIDDNSCGTTNELPSDNGTTIESYCNYCDPDWINLGECLENNTIFNNYYDSNFCYSTTNLSEDSPPINDGAWTSCDYFDNDFTCVMSEEPYLKEKIEYTCQLPNNNIYECINIVGHEQDSSLQVNPQKKEKSAGLITIKSDVETRETFTTQNGLLNAYYTDKNLLPRANFTVTTICNGNNESLSSTTRITPIMKDLDGTNEFILWSKKNAGYIFIIFLILLLVAFLIGSLWKNIRGG